MSLHSSKTVKFRILEIILLCMVTGCSGGSGFNNPVEPQTTFEKSGSGNLDILPIGFCDDRNAVGIMLGYSLTILSDSKTAELIPIRTSTIGESYIASGKSYFDTSFCRDCFRISELGYENEKIIIKFSIRHPFAKGNIAQPPTSKNRLDLDLFDTALIVAPKPLSPQNYSLMSVDIELDAIENPFGFTREIANLTGSDVALPYILIVDDSASTPPIGTFNRFEMGSSKNFEVKFPIESGEMLVFDLYLTFGYGSSAVLADRLNPKYFNPEFNRKAAWKVDVVPPNGSNLPQLGNTWNASNDSTEYIVTVKVYDWQIGANVDPNLTNTSDIHAASNVSYVSVEIPGMTDMLKQVAGNSYVPGGTGMPDSPLVYRIPIANENLLGEGRYVGLVEVHDEREPLNISQGRDYLIHTPDGVILNPYEISSYTTYQTFIATVVVGSMNPGNLIWVKQAGGPDIDFSFAVTTLSDNSIVATGSFSDQAIFGSGEINETVLNSDGDRDFFIARYNSNGTLAWVKRAGGLGRQSGERITTLSDNSTVVIGEFNRSSTFGPGEMNETVLTAPQYADDIFIARYNPNGTLAWAKRVGGEVTHKCRAITTLSDNSLIIAGYFNYSVTFAPGELNETILTSIGETDIFIARYKPDGTLAWAKSAGGSSYDNSFAITTLSDDTSVVVGSFNNSATFGTGEPNQTILTSVGDYDVFIARFNPDGTLLSAKHAGGGSSDKGNTVTTLSDNSTIVAGQFSASATFGTGEPNQTILTSVGDYDMFIARYNPNGTLAWAKRAGGTTDDLSYGITALSDNSTVVTGTFGDSTSGGTATFGLGEINETTLTSAGSKDIFIARYNFDGTLVWAKRAGGYSVDNGEGITAFTDNSTVVTGSFNISALFGMGEPNYTALTSVGEEDIFIARFAP